MRLIGEILAGWFLLSIPASLILGRLIRAGHGQDATICQCDRHFLSTVRKPYNRTPENNRLTGETVI